MRLDGKVAVVTGGSSGIGRGIAVKFSEEGARVAVLDIREESRLDSETPSTVEVIKSRGGSGVYLKTDVTRSGEVNEAMEKVLAAHGKVDILVNCAGIFIRNCVADISDEEWDQVMQVNVSGYFYTCRRLIPEMVKQGYGKIVNISSIHGLLGTGTAASYCASRGAVTNLTRQLAVDYARAGITVNAIAPGTIPETAMCKPFAETPEIRKEYVARTMMPRLGTAEDIAYAAVYLASPESDWVTGQCLAVDGGWTAW